MVRARCPAGTMGRFGPRKRNQSGRRTRRRSLENYSVWQEQEPGSGGKESAENTARNLAGFAIHTERVTGEKQVALGTVGGPARSGERPPCPRRWNQAYIDEHCAAPNGKYKDQIDASAGAFMKLARKRRFFVATGDCTCHFSAQTPVLRQKWQSASQRLQHEVLETCSH